MSPRSSRTAGSAQSSTNYFTQKYNANHAETLVKCQRFWLVHVRKSNVEGNTDVERREEASSDVILQESTGILSVISL